MKKKAPAIPATRQSTIRQQIVDVLGQRQSARDISAAVGIAEKEVYGHLEHIQHSLRHDRRRLEVTPPRCRLCGFVFAKRSRLHRPGKCPKCRGESIEEPLFRIT